MFWYVSTYAFDYYYSGLEYNQWLLREINLFCFRQNSFEPHVNACYCHDFQDGVAGFHQTILQIHQYSLRVD
jgi:hypothetical protein